MAVTRPATPAPTDRDALRARLERLNRGRLVGQHDLPAKPPPPTETICDLDEWVAGVEVENQAGRHYAIRRTIASLSAPIAVELAAPVAPRHAQHAATDRYDAEIDAFAAHWPARVMMLDLETCGFAGSMTFLIGLLHLGPDGLAIEQLLARNYAEERAILASLWQIAEGKDVLVTFNGKSFDWPMVSDRSTLHRLLPAEAAPPREAGERPPQLLHVDLLHHARRRWKDRLADCKLQTLEQHICRRHRRGDVPGSQIPATYHEFVRTGDARAIGRVLHHNALDLLTLAQLAVRMAGTRRETVGARSAG